MKKILILGNSSSGLYMFRFEVIKSLVEDGYDVSIGVPVDDKTHFFKEVGCRIIEIPFERRGLNPFAELKLLFTYVRLMNEIKPIVTLAYTMKPNIYGGIASRLTGVPHIANIAGLNKVVIEDGPLQYFTRFLYRRALKKDKLLFCQNSFDLQFLKDHGIKVPHMILIPGSGVNLDKFKYIEYPDNDEKIIFNSVFRIMEVKGINEYLYAIKVLSKKYSNVEFRLFGGYDDNEYKEKVDKAVADGYLKYMGLVPDIRPYITDCHALIHPTYYEGMSNAVQEHAASGRVCLVSNVPGSKEIVDDGVTGYVFQVRDGNAIIDAVDKFMALSLDERVAMGLAGRRKMEKEFDRNIIIGQYKKAVKSFDK